MITTPTLNFEWWRHNPPKSVQIPDLQYRQCRITHMITTPTLNFEWWLHNAPKSVEIPDLQHRQCRITPMITTPTLNFEWWRHNAPKSVQITDLQHRQCRITPMIEKHFKGFPPLSGDIGKSIISVIHFFNNFDIGEIAANKNPYIFSSKQLKNPK